MIRSAFWKGIKCGSRNLGGIRQSGLSLQDAHRAISKATTGNQYVRVTNRDFVFGQKRPGCLLGTWRSLSTPAKQLDEMAQSKTLTATASVAEPNATTVTVSWSGPEAQTATFHATWLRYNCQCRLCKQEHSEQRISDVYNLLPAYTLQGARVAGDLLEVEWKEEKDHVGKFPLSFLQDNSYDEKAINKAREARKPVYLTDGKMPEVQYEDIMNSDKGVLKWLTHLNEYGICLVKGVPSEDKSVKRVVERIWPVQHTIYGDMFDVVSLPTEGTINIAYTSMGLGNHMDLPYYESPPGIQFLHCLQLDSCVKGGANSFLDMFMLAEQLRERHPEDFATLTRVPATFVKHHFNRENPVSMSHTKPHIHVNQYGDVVGVNWSTAHEGPLNVPHEDVEPYYRAYHKLATMIRDSKDCILYGMVQGDMVSFNNRRFTHARDGFQLNGGMRHLQGCYLNIDEFRSRFEVLSKLYGDGRQSMRVGNNDLQ